MADRKRKMTPEDEAALQARRAYMRDYMREWRRKNPERAKKHVDDYWKRKAAQLNDN